MWRTRLFLALAVLALPHTAAAVCTTDAECKGNRICEQGLCVNPPERRDPGATPTSAVAAPPVGWGDSGANAGYIATGATLLLALASELTKEDQIPSLPIGVIATALVAAGGPILASAGSSERRGTGAIGSLGLRIAGWITYGLALANATGLIMLSLADIEAPDGQVFLTGVIGGASLLLFSLDAAGSAAEARTLAERLPNVQSTSSSMPLSPVVAMRRMPEGHVASFAGFAGSF